MSSVKLNSRGLHSNHMTFKVQKRYYGEERKPSQKGDIVVRRRRFISELTEFS